jgi:hypothetical protein
VGREVLGELVVGEASGLWEAVHAFANFEKHAPVDDEGCEVVCFDDEVGQKGGGDPHVFFALHWCVEIEVFCVAAHEAGAGGRDGAVDE